MKNISLLLVALFIVLNLTGCGEDKPSDVAVGFVKSLSDLDIQDAKEYLKDETRMDRLEQKCARKNVMKMKKIVDDYIDSNAKALKKSNQELEKRATELQKKYPNGINKLSKEKQDEIVEELLNIIDIEGENSKFIKKVLKQMILSEITGKNLSEYNVIMNAMIGDGNNITQECLSKVVPYYSNIDNINVIKTNTDADISEVKLELVYKDGTSKKKSIDLEKIQNKWKVKHPFDRY